MQAINHIIPALMEFTEATQTLPPSPSGNPWSQKWLRLKTHSQEIAELESVVTGYCSEMWRNPMDGRLLILHGFNGSGKTHCAKAVHRWIKTVGHSRQWIPKTEVVQHLHSLFWSWPELLDSLKNGNWDLIEDCVKVPCLIIDELGGGHDPSRVGVDKLCQILSRREKKWTMITTNTKPEAWADAFDARVASRFLRNSQIVDLSEVPDFATI